MVFFTCAGCNESLKKNQVQNHKYRCARSHTVSCVDCQKDFHGRDYDAHTKCISEDQKYGGAKYVAKENKGEVKQQRWFETVQQAIEMVAGNHDRQLQQLLENIKNYPNIPNKEKKFRNFVGNSLRERNADLVGQAWTALSTAAAELKEKREKEEAEAKEAKKNTDKVTVNDASQINGDSTPTEEGNSKKKRKAVGFVEDQNSTDDSTPKSVKKQKISDDPLVIEDEKKLLSESKPSNNNKTSMKSLIKLFLNEAENKELKLKRLKKMVAREMQIGDEEQKQELGAKIDNYLTSHNTKYATDGKIVRLAVEA